MTGISPTAFTHQGMAENLAQCEAELARIVGVEVAARVYRDHDAACVDIALANRALHHRTQILALSPTVESADVLWARVHGEVAAGPEPSRAKVVEALARTIERLIRGEA